MHPAKVSVESMKTASQVGLGFRREHLDQFQPGQLPQVDFLEVAPENWMTLGGRLGKAFRAYTEAHRFIAHGLSLSLGGITPLDQDFLKQIKAFLDLHQIEWFSEHLCACSDAGHLYDLMPIPFTDEAVFYVAGRIRETMERLDRRIAIENVSTYLAHGHTMSEAEFTCAVLAEADCDLLLDVNNVYVNSINHGFDAQAFIDAMPTERVRYIHIAGHHRETEHLIVDTHGAEVDEPVWALLAHTYRTHGPLPTLLERDFNLPPLAQLLQETETIRHYLQQSHPLSAEAC